jgi:transcriptional regulator with XRE-family HTH domain
MQSNRKNQQRQTILRSLREQASLTQEQLAVHLGKSLSTVKRWEKGDEPSMTKPEWKKFCALVGRTFDELPDSLSEPSDEDCSEHPQAIE